MGATINLIPTNCDDFLPLTEEDMVTLAKAQALLEGNMSFGGTLKGLLDLGFLDVAAFATPTEIPECDEDVQLPYIYSRFSEGFKLAADVGYTLYMIS